MPVRFERVYSEEGEAGFSVSWPSNATPVEILEECVDRDQALAETDVIATDLTTWKQVFSRPLEQVSTGAIDKLAERGHVVQFNAPFWSLAFWPASDELEASMEFTGSRYEAALPAIIWASTKGTTVPTAAFTGWVQHKISALKS